MRPFSRSLACSAQQIHPDPSAKNSNPIRSPVHGRRVSEPSAASATSSNSAAGEQSPERCTFVVAGAGSSLGTSGTVMLVWRLGPCTVDLAAGLRLDHVRH